MPKCHAMPQATNSFRVHYIIYILYIYMHSATRCHTVPQQCHSAPHEMVTSDPCVTFLSQGHRVWTISHHSTLALFDSQKVTTIFLPGPNFLAIFLLSNSLIRGWHSLVITFLFDRYFLIFDPIHNLPYFSSCSSCPSSLSNSTMVSYNSSGLRGMEVAKTIQMNLSKVCCFVKNHFLSGRGLRGFVQP